MSPGAKAAIHYAKKNLTRPLAVADLASQAGLAASAFRERFSKEMGQSPKEYILLESAFRQDVPKNIQPDAGRIS